MKIFVSGQLDQKVEIRKVFAQLESHGHTITHDWTRTDDITARYSAVPVEAGRRAAKDILGVLEADVYIILTDNENCGKGMYVELGAALAQANSGSIREVAVVGPKNHESIFYYHPAVNHFETFELYIQHLSQKYALQSAI